MLPTPALDQHLTMKMHQLLDRCHWKHLRTDWIIINARWFQAICYSDCDEDQNAHGQTGDAQRSSLGLIQLLLRVLLHVHRKGVSWPL